jgi:hypothetical protein
MSMGTCQSCGSAVPLLAVACPHCGATHKVHATGITVVVGVLALAVLAGGFALSLHVSRKIDLGAPADTPANGTPAGESQAQTQTPPVADDFGWLSTGMESCESEARNDLPKVYFMVVPLAPAEKNDQKTASQALDRAGEAHLISTEDALAGLRNGSLRINNQPFTFSILDPATSSVYTWKSKVGASKLASTDAEAIANFKIRVYRGDAPGNTQWGDSFVRAKGTCHWVNVLFDQ